MKLDEFQEIQRWMKVRDFCEDAQTCLRYATSLAENEEDTNEGYLKVAKWIDEYRDKAMKELEKIIENEDWDDYHE